MRSGIFSWRVCALLLALLLAISFSPGLSAQQQSSSVQLTPLQLSLIQDSLQQLQTIKELSSLLGPDLLSWPQRILDLQLTLAQVKQRDSEDMAKLRVDLAHSEAARQRAQDASDKSQAAQIAESKTFNDYKKASESAQSVLQAQLAQERGPRLFTDYLVWASTGAAAGAIGGAAVGKSALSSAEGAGLGAASALLVKLFGGITHLY